MLNILGRGHPSKRERLQCNHCQYADWEYGSSVYSGWYLCSIGRDTRLDWECQAFKHFEGKLIRKQWLK